MPLLDRLPESSCSMLVCMSHDMHTKRSTGCVATYSPQTLCTGHHIRIHRAGWYDLLLVFLQGMPAVSVLHNAVGSPSAPQAAPAPITKAKTFQKAKSLLSFRHQGSTAASFGSSHSSMLPAAYPALPPGHPHHHPVWMSTMQTMPVMTNW